MQLLVANGLIQLVQQPSCAPDSRVRPLLLDQLMLDPFAADGAEALAAVYPLRSNGEKPSVSRPSFALRRWALQRLNRLNGVANGRVAA